MTLAALSISTLVVLSSWATPCDAAPLAGLIAAPPSHLQADAQEGKKEKDDTGQETDKKKRKAEKAKRDASARAAAKTLREGLKAKESNARIASLTEASSVDHPTVIAEMAKGLKDEDR